MSEVRLMCMEPVARILMTTVTNTSMKKKSINIITNKGTIVMGTITIMSMTTDTTSLDRNHLKKRRVIIMVTGSLVLISTSVSVSVKLAAKEIRSLLPTTIQRVLIPVTGTQRTGSAAAMVTVKGIPTVITITTTAKKKSMRTETLSV